MASSATYKIPHVLPIPHAKAGARIQGEVSTNSADKGLLAIKQSLQTQYLTKRSACINDSGWEAGMLYLGKNPTRTEHRYRFKTPMKQSIDDTLFRINHYGYYVRPSANLWMIDVSLNGSFAFTIDPFKGAINTGYYGGNYSYSAEPFDDTLEYQEVLLEVTDNVNVGNYALGFWMSPYGSFTTLTSGALDFGYGFLVDEDLEAEKPLSPYKIKAMQAMTKNLYERGPGMISTSTKYILAVEGGHASNAIFGNSLDDVALPEHGAAAGDQLLVGVWELPIPPGVTTVIVHVYASGLIGTERTLNYETLSGSSSGTALDDASADWLELTIPVSAGFDVISLYAKHLFIQSICVWFGDATYGG